MCERQGKELNRGMEVELNPPLDVLTMMPEHVDGWSKPKETEGPAEVELDS